MSNILIGLTGPTGSGKGLVASAWAECGAAVLDADRYAREVVQPGQPCLAALVHAFSERILQTDGTLDRAMLAKIAFADPEKTALLGRITHPAICHRMAERAQELWNGGYRIVVFDSPLLFEAEQHTACDHTVAVIADPELRLRRIIARDGLTEEAARQRIAAQPTDEYYRERADILWENNGTPEQLTVTAKEWLRWL